MNRQTIPIDISRGYRPSKFKQLDNSQLYNFYISSSSGDPALYPTAGHKQQGNFSYGRNARGIFQSTKLKQIFVVFGVNIFLVDALGSHILINIDEPLVNSSSTVYITENNINQVVFSDGVKIYVFNILNSQFNSVVLPDGLIPGMVIYKDSRFIVNNKSNNEWHLSGFNTALSWDPLDKSIVDGITVGLASVKTQLIVFQREKATVFYDAGLSGFPYQRSNTILFEYGCLATNSIAEGYGYVFWLGADKQSSPTIMVSDGGSPVSVEVGDINFIIDQFKFIEECDSFVYKVDGHIFYQINWEKDNFSLLYDLTNKTFSVVTDCEYNVHPLKHVTRFNGTQYALSRNDGFLYLFDVNLYSENGKTVPRSLTSINYSKQNEKFSIPKLTVYMEQGMTNVPSTDCAPSCSPCRDASLYLSVSHDKGVTFPIFRTQQLAKLGQRAELMIFNNLGSGRFWTFKFEFFSPERVCIFSIDMDIAQ